MKQIQTQYLSNYLVFVDAETSGFEPIRNDVTSIGAIVTDCSHNVLADFYTTVKPEINKFTSEEALVVSGFSKEALLTHKPQRQACIDFMRFLKPYLEEFPQMMVSHTVNGFDWRFIEWMFRKQELNYNLYRVLSPEFQESTIKLGRQAGHATNKLDEWAERLNLTFNHHNALDDARVCFQIHKHLSK